MTPRLASFIGLAIIAASVTARGAALDTDAIDRLVERSMARWEIPAVAVAAVDRGRVVLSRVHGFGDVERGLAVTPRTLFAVGSIAKSFTVVALARIADNGGLGRARQSVSSRTAPPASGKCPSGVGARSRRASLRHAPA